MFLHRSAESGVEWELDVVDSWWRTTWCLVECLIDTDSVWEFQGRKWCHVGGEGFLDEWDGEGFAVKDLSRC